MENNRREFLKQIGYLSAGALFIPGFAKAVNPAKTKELFFDISLAQWSLHKALFAGELTNLDFPATAKNEFGIKAIEYVNQFFKDKAKDKSYLNKLNSRCNDLGVKQLLIMIDGEGPLAAADNKKRTEAIENHYKWVEAANHLGCHSIRVNLNGGRDASEMQKASVDSLGRLAEFAKDFNVNIIVENHGGYSSNAEWLVNVIKNTGMGNCGTLPDFGNFTISKGNTYDRYKGTRQLMPYAKGVSAKSYTFNDKGYETTIDYPRMLKIVKDAGFTGHIGIEYEGDELSEHEGIKATKKLLEKVGTELTK